MIDLIAVSEAYREWLAWLCLCGLLLLSSALVLWWLVNAVSGPVLRLWRKLTFIGRVAVCSLFGFGVIDAGTKTNPPPSRIVGPPLVVTVSADDVSRGWRVESVATNAVPSAWMPSNAVEYARWSLRGGRETWFPLDLGGFVFPLGTNRIQWLRVLSGGTVETFGPDAASISAAMEYASLVPGVSRFGWADSGGGAARLLRWESVFAGRDQTGEYDAEILLFANGDFTTRSNDVETVCRRVNPDDWDGDGECRV